MFNNNLINLLIILFIAYLLYQNRQNKNKIEKMSNVTSIKEQIQKLYKADIESIRNLSEVAKKLQKGGLTVAGDLTVDGNIKSKKDLTVDGNLTVKKDSNVKGQTTINKLYGGQSTHGGWRDIIVNGGHIRFVVGKNKFGFHENANAFHYYNGNSDRKLPIWKGIHAKGNIHVDDYISTRRLDVRNDKGKGTTHFNYAHKGDNYFRAGTNQLDGLTKIANINAHQHGGEVAPGDGHFGGWRGWTGCPAGQFMTGVKARIESNQGGGDDTAMNGIRFRCSSIN